MIRVTVNTQINRSLYDIQANNAKLQHVQDQLSTGNRILRPSDDPTANARAMVLKTTISENETYKSNVQNMQGFVNVTDSSMGSYMDALQRLRELAVRGANGTLRAEDKQAIVQETTQIKEQIRMIGNTQYDGRYVFGGIKTNQQPYPTDVTLSPNDNGKLTQDIAQGVTMNYNITGVSVFGDTSPGNTNNIFSVIDNLNSLLSVGNSTVDISQQSIAQIDSFIAQAGNQRTTLGGWSNRLDLGNDRLTSINTDLSNLLEDTKGTDYAAATLQMNQDSATLQAALAVGAKAMPLTLVDFLK